MDHLIQIGGVGAPDEPFMEGCTMLFALAAVTSRIRLATLASSVAYRNPTHLAKIAAGVDQISRGRLTLGIGAGWFAEEYRQYGWDFPPEPAARIRQMIEAVSLIKAMWIQPRTSFHGRYFHAEDAILEPKPVQKPHLPIMIAGGGEHMMLRAVARHGDACNVFGDTDTVRHKFEVTSGGAWFLGLASIQTKRRPMPTTLRPRVTVAAMCGGGPTSCAIGRDAGGRGVPVLLTQCACTAARVASGSSVRATASTAHSVGERVSAPCATAAALA